MEIPAVKPPVRPRRSKGCSTCIKRKVKCDEKAPQCGQCLKGGRTCSGIAMAIFMNTDSTTLATTSTFAARDQHIPKDGNPIAGNSKTTAFIKHTPRSAEPSSTKWIKRKSLLAPKPEIKRGPECLPLSEDAHEFALLPSISVSEVFNHQLLAKFVTFFAKNPSNRVFNNWMSELPRILADPKSAAVKKSIVAAAMVHSAGILINKTILIEGYKWYGAGLTSQRKELEAINQGKRKPTFEELCTPLMLSFCEISCCTSQTAYFHHLLGAAELISKHGPAKCTNGVLLEMFQLIRIQLIYPTIIMRIPSVLGTLEWLTIPFSRRSKTSVDISIDTITIISELLSRMDNLNSPKMSLSAYDAETEKQAITERAQSLKLELDIMWDDLEHLAQAQGWQGETFNGVPGFDNLLAREQSHTTSPSTTTDEPEPQALPTAHIDLSVQYPAGTPRSSFPQATSFPPGASLSAIASRPVCFYSTARLLVLSILDQLGETPDLYYEQLEAHCGSVLHVCQDMTRLGIGYAYLRLILPLHVVCMLSPKRKQVEEARYILAQWRKTGAVAGICEMALRSTAYELMKHETESYETQKHVDVKRPST